jgi:hypothetical protein
MNSVNLLSAVTSPTTSPTRTRTVGAWAVNFENAFNISEIKKNVSLFIQSDQEENKSEQALQLIGHVVAEFYANKRSMHRRGLKRDATGKQIFRRNVKETSKQTFTVIVSKTILV